MKFTTALTTALAFSTSANGLKILMNNDDGFGSGNLRELYKLLKADGHDVLVVAPAVQQSGQGGRTVFTEYANLTSPGQYDIVPTGAPSIGRDPMDDQIWYYNGTPAACTFVALDWVLPRYYPEWAGYPDLFIAGPNYGTNLGAFVYSLSGTCGATYSAIMRSIPGIAISASNTAVPYFNVTNSTHPAARAAKVAYTVVKEFIDNTDGEAVLPLAYGININIPELDSDEMPPVVQTRFTGDANVDVAVYDEETKLFDWENLSPVAAGVNTCYNGDCGLPGETYVVGAGSVSVSAFTVDYSAPRIPYTDMVYGKVAGLFAASGNSTAYKKRSVAKRGLGRKRLLTGRDVMD